MLIFCTYRFLYEQINQSDFLEMLQNLYSPVLPCTELGTLKVEACRIMDSAKRPLWLVWNVRDELSLQIGKYISPTTRLLRVLNEIVEPNSHIVYDLDPGESSAIFKNGDDLRQDMLTLQVSFLIGFNSCIKE